MEIVIDNDDSTPLLAQLMGQIKKGVISGKIRPGNALPSCQQLANDLELDSKMVARAYRLLELDLVIQTRGRLGAVVHADAEFNCTRVGWSWCPPMAVPS